MTYDKKNCFRLVFHFEPSFISVSFCKRCSHYSFQLVICAVVKQSKVTFDESTVCLRPCWIVIQQIVFRFSWSIDTWSVVCHIHKQLFGNLCALVVCKTKAHNLQTFTAGLHCCYHYVDLRTDLVSNTAPYWCLPGGDKRWRKCSYDNLLLTCLFNHCKRKLSLHATSSIIAISSEAIQEWLCAMR